MPQGGVRLDPALGAAAAQLRAACRELTHNGDQLAPAAAIAQRVRELDRALVFHSWSAQAEVSPTVISRTEGPRAWNGGAWRSSNSLHNEAPRILCRSYPGRGSR
jgi:hypothetical protein